MKYTYVAQYKLSRLVQFCFICLTLGLTACSQGIDVAKSHDVLPFSDPANTGGWVLNREVSDEFDGETIDEARWYIVGKFEDGKPVYRHPDKPNKKVWRGRAPSQFSGRNYRLENGKLILETRWEPDFPFSDEIRVPVFGEAMPHANITIWKSKARPQMPRSLARFGLWDRALSSIFLSYLGITVMCKNSI